ncbi:C1 family peptidase [Leptospira sp. 96542]|nr:C1 family peptidase [Leptospira sp. 96542]
MPIRMTDDENEPEEEEESKSEGGSFFLLAILGALGGLIYKYPKVFVPILIVGLLGLICIGSISEEDSEYEEEEESSEVMSEGPHKLGAKFDMDRYDRTPVYEPLSKGMGNEIPSKVSLLKYAPKRKNQGEQGSCTGWAVSYAARTILHAKATGEDPNQVSFSPAYLFNQNTDKKCDGAYPVDLLEGLKKQGNLQYADFPYDEESCRKKPTSEQKDKAKEYRIEGYQRLTEDGEKYDTDIDSIKQYLAQGSPVVISMEVGGTFLDLTEAVWHPTNTDYKAVKRYKKGNDDDGEWGGHAMTAIGYDDEKDGGAVQIMNSWGEGFGKKGIFWLRYEDFNTFVREVYALYPPKTFEENESVSYHFGLLENSSKEFIQLKQVKNNHFQTKEPIKVGTRFKVSVKNDKPTYLYIFGQETDGSSYVLFPYTDKHSPYCGTTGTRVFPKRQSLEVDGLGKKDRIVFVLGKKQLNYKEINKAVNKSGAKSYLDKFSAALKSKISTSSEFSESGDTIDLVSSDHDPDTVDVVLIEFDKEK